MISTESTSNNLDWSSLHGTTLEGGYQLAELIMADERMATFRVRVLGDFRRKTFANFYQADGAPAEQQVELWESARAIRHPNLSVPLGAGRVPMQGAEVIYIVLDKPDQTLSGVLAERTLANNEAQETLSSIANALDQLHTRGFVHGCVSPEEVFAFGDAIKLSTDCIRRANSPPVLETKQARYLAPESAKENITPAADVWCTGATLLEALTRKKSGPGCREDAAAFGEPIKRILEACLDPDPAKRARLADLERLRAGEVVREVAAAVTPAAVTAGPQAMSTAAEQELSGIDERRTFQRPFQSPRTWVYAAVALLIVVVLLWAERPKRAVIVTGSGKPAAIANTRAAGTRGSATAWPTRTLAPETVHRDVHPDARIAEAARPAVPKSGDPAVWRVVLYTFSRQDDAQRRAQAINENHPGLDAHTFSPSGAHMYLVVAGGRMTRSEAAQLRLKALRQGMPRDSYIQNYKQ